MKPVSPAAAYAALIPTIVEAGRECGYAIAPHGSLARDLDLIAVPWTDEAVSADALVLRILSATGAELRDGGKSVDGEWKKTRGDLPEAKPHGRLAWSIYLDRSGLYVDLSVMPRKDG